MAKKKSKIKLEDKSLKKEVINKSIDWASVGDSVVIVGTGFGHLKNGVEYEVTKATAKLIVNKGGAKLK